MASRIAFRLQAGGHRQSRLMICTFHLGFSLAAGPPDQLFSNAARPCWQITLPNSAKTTGNCHQ